MIRRAGLVAMAAAVALGAAAAPALATTVTAARDGVSATLTYSGSVVRTPGPITLTLTRAGATQAFAGLQGDPVTYEAFSPAPLRVRDLDGDGAPEALVRLFSGGAHCCEVLDVAWFDPAANAFRLASHRFDDASWALRDLGGTRAPEFVSWDARWAYWGGVYATSPQPLRIWSFSHGAFTDVTRGFPAALRRDQARQLRYAALARRQGAGGRGQLAAYVADGYSLGRGPAAVARIRPLLPEKGRARFLKALRNNLVRLGYSPAGGAL